MGTIINKDELEKQLLKHLSTKTKATFENASNHCKDILNRSSEIINAYLGTNSIDANKICFVAVGSVGRNEALSASDLDIIPVVSDTETLDFYRTNHDKNLRKKLSDDLGVKVSKGEDLTKCVSISELTDSNKIGGDEDNSSELTKRILILTEGALAGGNYELDEIRRNILNAYADSERTSGRHVLSLCNDIARYYRTLCIEYKAKIDIEDKDWCTRNIKLRHSRKFWYFTSMIAITSLANKFPDGEEDYINGILQSFKIPPSLRLFLGLNDNQHMYAGRVMKRFAWFLDFMSDQTRREQLASTEYDKRYEISKSNHFPMMKMNSDQLHSEIINIIESYDKYTRLKIYDWFLL